MQYKNRVAVKPILIQQKIYEIRGQKVMLDFDLAVLYGTQTRTLKASCQAEPRSFSQGFHVSTY